MGQQPAQAPGVATSPYGILPEAPKIAAAVPEHRIGLSLRPAGGLGPGGSPRPTSLMTPRSITPVSAMRVRPRRSRDAGRSALARSSTGEAAALFGGAGLTPASAAMGAATDAGGTPGSAAGIFVARDNPRRLFIRDPLPSTAAASSSSPAPFRGTPLHSQPGPSNGTPAFAGDEEARGRNTYYSAGRAARRSTGDGANGKGPAEEEEGQAHEGGLSNEQVSRLLPSLSRDAEASGYYCEPGLRQLAAMARCDGGGALRSVANFVVGRRGYGSVRFLDPVDVRRLPLDDIVRFEHGTVEVYLNESQKPEVGQGLNRPAVVTLHKVLKIDKATGRPTSDPDAIDKFRRKLKRAAAGQSAKFVSYDPQDGTWVFEVEHFSKYGLPMDESDSEGEADSGGEGSEWVEVSVGQPQGLQRGELADMDVESDVEDSGSMAQGRAPQDGSAGGPRMFGVRSLEGSGSPGSSMQGEDEVGQGEAGGLQLRGRDSAAGDALTSPLLQVSLPAGLALDPRDLQETRDSLFPQQPPPAAQGPREGPGAGRGGPAPHPAAQQHQHRAAAAPGGATAHLRGGPRVWRAPPAAVSAAVHTGLPGGGGVVGGGPGGGVQRGVSGALGGSQCLVTVAGGQQQVEPEAAGGLVDAGLMLGRSFRVGWGPNNQLILPSALVSHTSSAPASEVAIQRIAVNALAAIGGPPAPPDPHLPLLMGPLDALRGVGGGAKSMRQVSDAQVAAAADRWRAALRLHLQHSRPVQDGASADSPGAQAGQGQGQGQVPAQVPDAPYVPRWAFVCGRGADLEAITTAYIEQVVQHIQQHQGQLSAIRQLVGRQEAETWELLRVLYAAVPGETMQETETDAGDAQGMEGVGDDMEEDAAERRDQGHGEEAAGDDRPSGSRSNGQFRLVQLRRWARLSQWLRDRAKPLVEGDLARSTGDHSRTLLLLQLLSGHQLAVAAGVAASTGDVRLATLVAQAGRSEQVLMCAAHQLQVWQAAGFLEHIDAERLAAYKLLAGDPAPAISLLSLDWRRAMGMHLWYAQPAGHPIPMALASFTAAAEEGQAPPPLPLYEQRLGIAAGNGVYDTAYHLMQLFCDPSRAQDPGFLACLLRPEGYSPEVLDALPGWLLYSALAAIGALPQRQPDQPGAEQVLALHMDVIGQLSCLPGLCEWCVYVALHLPEDGVRQKVVQQLLLQRVPEWADDEAKLSFLRDTLQLPGEWLAEALAAWAHCNRDSEGELGHLLDAGCWRQAHALLADTVGPRLFLAKRYGPLGEYVSRLAQHSGEVDSSAAAAGWQYGGGLYRLYLQLRAAVLQEGPESLLLQYGARLRDLLLEAPRRHTGPLHAPVFSTMAADLSTWVLSAGAPAGGPAGGPCPDALQRQLLAVSLHAGSHRDRLSSIQLAAATLAATVA